MLYSIIVPVIRNPIYIIASLIFVIVNMYMPFLLFSSFDISGINIGYILLRETFRLVTASIFMPGIGYLLKNIVSEGRAGVFDFMKGVRIYFSSILKVNLMITLISLLGIPAAVIFKPSMLMGTSLPLIQPIHYIVMFFIISPFFALWYPAMFIDKIGIAEIIGKAIITGKKAYLKLLLAVLIPLLPSFIYTVFIPLTGFFSSGYYFLFGTTFILSLFAMLFMFKIYYEER